MDTIARAAFVIAQAACMHAELAAMQAANRANPAQPPYKERDFLDLPNKYLVGHNAVIEYMME